MTPRPDDPIEAAFGQHGPALLLYARQWLDAAAAEDAVQRVFVRLITAGRLPTDLRPWLFRCVRNEAISMARSSRRRVRREAAVEPAPVFLTDADNQLDAAAAGRALATLPPSQREVVVLRIWSGLTLAEIAGITGLATSTLHDHYRAALAALRRQLEPP
jgi:RNA polymerase sigma factor (sigma-70 family)